MMEIQMFMIQTQIYATDNHKSIVTDIDKDIMMDFTKCARQVIMDLIILQANFLLFKSEQKNETWLSDK